MKFDNKARVKADGHDLGKHEVEGDEDRRWIWVSDDILEGFGGRPPQKAQVKWQGRIYNAYLTYDTFMVGKSRRPMYEWRVGRGGGASHDHKREWTLEEIIELDEPVTSVEEIEIVDMLHDRTLHSDISRDEFRAAKNFNEVQGDRLHPAHSHTLGNIMSKYKRQQRD